MSRARKTMPYVPSPILSRSSYLHTAGIRTSESDMIMGCICGRHIEKASILHAVAHRSIMPSAVLDEAATGAGTAAGASADSAAVKSILTACCGTGRGGWAPPPFSPPRHLRPAFGTLPREPTSPSANLWVVTK